MEKNKVEKKIDMAYNDIRISDLKKEQIWDKIDATKEKNTFTCMNNSNNKLKSIFSINNRWAFIPVCMMLLSIGLLYSYFDRDLNINSQKSDLQLYTKEADFVNDFGGSELSEDSFNQNKFYLDENGINIEENETQNITTSDEQDIFDSSYQQESNQPEKDEIESTYSTPEQISGQEGEIKPIKMISNHDRNIIQSFFSGESEEESFLEVFINTINELIENFFLKLFN